MKQKLFVVVMLIGVFIPNTKTMEQESIHNEKIYEELVTARINGFNADQKSFFNIVNKFIKSGGNGDAIINPEAKETLLMWCASLGFTETCSFLLDHNANIEKKDYLGRTALRYAILREQPEVCKLLLQQGAPLTFAKRTADLKSCDQLVALTYAYNCENIEKISQMIVDRQKTINENIRTGLYCLYRLYKNNDQIGIILYKNRKKLILPYLRPSYVPLREMLRAKDLSGGTPYTLTGFDCLNPNNTEYGNSKAKKSCSDTALYSKQNRCYIQ